MYFLTIWPDTEVHILYLGWSAFLNGNNLELTQTTRTVSDIPLPASDRDVINPNPEGTVRNDSASLHEQSPPMAESISMALFTDHSLVTPIFYISNGEYRFSGGSQSKPPSGGSTLQVDYTVAIETHGRDNLVCRKCDKWPIEHPRLFSQLCHRICKFVGMLNYYRGYTGSVFNIKYLNLGLVVAWLRTCVISAYLGCYLHS